MSKTPTAVSSLGLRTPKQARSRRTLEALRRSGGELFSTAGYAGATATGIAKSAGVATGTFYQYFRNKDELLREIAESRLVALNESLLRLLKHVDRSTELETQLTARVREVVTLVMDFHRSDPALHGTITERRYADPALDAFCRRYELDQLQYVVDFLEQLPLRGDVRSIAFVMVTMVEGVIHAHVLGRPFVSDDDVYETLVDSVIRVVLPLLE